MAHVRVAARSTSCCATATARVRALKERAIALAAHHDPLGFDARPAGRIDVVAIEGARLPWLQGAISL